MKKKAILLFCFAVISILLFRCSDNQHATETMVNSTGEGEELIRTHCITCHSLRYIDMQPRFPRKTWEKITAKMIKNFGADIPDSIATKIVDYIAARADKKD
jgi:mono/diheme cytochrome c family protein